MVKRSQHMRFSRLGCCNWLIACAAAGLTGCGYHTAGSTSQLAPGIQTIAVPIFTTRTQAYHTELAFTREIIQELNTRTRYQVLPDASPNADAVLSGTILNQTVVPLTYDSTTGETSSYLLTVTAKVILRAHDGRVLYENDALSFREQYQSTQDLSSFIREDAPAVRRLARDFAQGLVSDMLESF